MVELSLNEFLSQHYGKDFIARRVLEMENVDEGISTSYLDDSKSKVNYHTQIKNQFNLPKEVRKFLLVTEESMCNKILDRLDPDNYIFPQHTIMDGDFLEYTFRFLNGPIKFIFRNYFNENPRLHSIDNILGFYFEDHFTQSKSLLNRIYIESPDFYENKITSKSPNIKEYLTKNYECLKEKICSLPGGKVTTNILSVLQANELPPMSKSNLTIHGGTIKLTQTVTTLNVKPKKKSLCGVESMWLADKATNCFISPRYDANFYFAKDTSRWSVRVEGEGDLTLVTNNEDLEKEIVLIREKEEFKLPDKIININEEEFKQILAKKYISKKSG